MLACSSTPRDAAALAGRYELRSVDGRAVPVDALGGALGGDIRLTADGHVTRVVQYATSGIPGPIVNRGTGTYRARGSRITLTAASSKSGTCGCRSAARGALAETSVPDILNVPEQRPNFQASRDPV